MNLLLELVLRFSEICSHLLDTAQLNTTAIENFVICCKISLSLLTPLFNLSDVLAHLLLVNGVVGLLLLLHTFSTTNWTV
jgi:hypothetical protein